MMAARSRAVAIPVKTAKMLQARGNEFDAAAVRGTQSLLGEEADRFHAVVAAFDRVRRLFGFSGSRCR